MQTWFSFFVKTYVSTDVAENPRGFAPRFQQKTGYPNNNPVDPSVFKQFSPARRVQSHCSPNSSLTHTLCALLNGEMFCLQLTSLRIMVGKLTERLEKLTKWLRTAQLGPTGCLNSFQAISVLFFWKKKERKKGMNSVLLHKGERSFQPRLTTVELCHKPRSLNYLWPCK